MNPRPDAWPELPLAAWQDTYDTLHMWTQIVGKIRMTLTPLINHYWNATLYVSARGLTTSAIPYPRGVFEIEFDFIGHKLVIQTKSGHAVMVSNNQGLNKPNRVRGVFYPNQQQSSPPAKPHKP